MHALRRLLARASRAAPSPAAAAPAVAPSPAPAAAAASPSPAASVRPADAAPAILVTGGCGYIGTHTLVELLSRGLDVVVVDDLSNSSPESTRRAEKIAGKKVAASYTVSVCDGQALRDVFSRHAIEAVIHFAGLKSVTESTSNPLKYYNINVGGMVTLLEVMKEFGVFNLVFSSSATVYGHPQVDGPIDESHPVAPTNPYGRTKLMCEDIARDLAAADKRFKIALLRYFNPIGAHASGLIGEDPNDIPNNLIPYVTQVLVGRLPFLRVYGDDYKTVDGTGVRDFIHVSDLALGHVSAVEYLRKQRDPATPAEAKSKENLWIWNMGTGRGFSVLEVVRAIEKAAGKNVPVVMSPRRPGDCGEVIANTTKANTDLGWSATRGIEEMAATAWLFQSTHPEGYRTPPKPDATPAPAGLALLGTEHDHDSAYDSTQSDQSSAVSDKSDAAPAAKGGPRAPVPVSHLPKSFDMTSTMKKAEAKQAVTMFPFSRDMLDSTRGDRKEEEEGPTAAAPAPAPAPATGATATQA